jgi:cold shock protein
MAWRERISMERGVVKWFDSRMGYGFIIDEAGHDVFVHRRAVRQAGRRRLEPGEPVAYEAEATPRGMKVIRLVVPANDSVADEPIAPGSG